MNEGIAQAEAALKAAVGKVEELKQQQRDQINDAQRKIEAHYRPAMTAAEAAIGPARAALNDLLYEEGAKHPWVGRKVHRPMRTRGWRAAAVTERHGVIEAFKPGESYSGGALPKPGELTIRILKISGERSMQTETYWHDRKKLPDGYVFVDSPEAEQQES